MVWLGTLARKLTSHQMEVAPTAMTWCGEEVVLQTLDTGCALLPHNGGETETIFQPASLTTVQEGDVCSCPPYWVQQ